MQEKERYPYSLKTVLQQNTFENIADSNILSACIPRDLPVPKIVDSRRNQILSHQVQRHPGYISSTHIDQIFSYIGFVKRVKNQELRPYLPLLFRGLNQFLRVLEEIVYAPDIVISKDIYVEQKEGLENFFAYFHGRENYNIDWIEKIWKNQKNYLENIDMLLETLKLSGLVFDFKEDPLYKKIVSFCKDYFRNDTSDPPCNTDISFVANCFSRAAQDREPKTIWSGDMHITRILQALYANSDLTKTIPQIYQRANYNPHNFSQLFPK